MAVTVASLISQGKVLSDKVGDASIDDTTGWLVFVNRAVESLWKLITGLDPNASFAQVDFTLTSTAGGATKDLTTVGTRFRALHGVDYQPDTPTRRTVPRRPFRERNTSAVGWWTPTVIANDRGYDLRGTTLTITPYEVAAGTYRAYYRQGPYLFTGPTDATTLDPLLEPHAEYLEVAAARRALAVEESNTGSLDQRLAELTGEITSAHTRDDGEPAVLADVEGDGWSWR